MPETTITPTRVQEALERVLASPVFANAERQSKFLRHVVERWLRGEPDSLKEYAIGVEVYGRDRSFDPRLDSIVRVEASRLRAKLLEYYAGPGSGDSLRIGLPKGGYAPAFEAQEPTNSVAPTKARSFLAPGLAALGLVAVAAGVWVSQRPRPSVIDSIAVIEFANLSSNPALSDLARSLARETAARIKRQSGVNCEGPVAPEVKFEAAAALRGSLRQQGETIRVSAELIRNSDQANVWSAAYERPARDSNAWTAAVAESIGAELAERLAQRRPWRREFREPKPEAAALYLKATAPLKIKNEDTAGRAAELANAAAMLDRAVATDPLFAEAWSALARVQQLRVDHSRGEEATGLGRKAQAAAERALALDDSQTDALGVLGALLLHRDWKFPEAEARLRRAVELDPYHVESQRLLSHALAFSGRFEEAIEQSAALEIRKPDVIEFAIQKGLLQFLGRKFADATETGNRILKADPENYIGLWLRGISRFESGERAAGIADLRTSARKRPNNSRPLTGLGYALARTGQHREARELLAAVKGLQRSPSPSSIALIHAALGETSVALDLVEEGYRTHDLNIPYARIDPRYDGLRREPRFRAVMEKLEPIRPAGSQD